MWVKAEIGVQTINVINGLGENFKGFERVGLTISSIEVFQISYINISVKYGKNLMYYSVKEFYVDI